MKYINTILVFLKYQQYFVSILYFMGLPHIPQIFSGCEWGDLNPHDLNSQQILSLVRLPIPPHSQIGLLGLEPRSLRYKQRAFTFRRQSLKSIYSITRLIVCRGMKCTILIKCDFHLLMSQVSILCCFWQIPLR